MDGLREEDQLRDLYHDLKIAKGDPDTTPQEVAGLEREIVELKRKITAKQRGDVELSTGKKHHSQ